MQAAVAGCLIERPKKSAVSCFFGTLDLDVIRQKIDHPANLSPMTVGADNDPKGRQMVTSIGAQQLDDFQELWMQRRFSAQQPNALP